MILIPNLQQKEKLILLFSFKQFYISSTTHLLNKMKNVKTLKYFQCLSPDKIKSHKSVRYVKNIVNSLPITDVDLEKLMCEWRLLQMDEEVQFTLGQDKRIDSYWSSIFALKMSCNIRYPEIKKVIQATLALAHDCADVERGFFISGLLLTDDKAHMSERMLNAKLAVSEGLKKYDYKVHEVSIPNNFIYLAQNAHRSYQSFVESERRIADEKTRQRTVEAEHQEKKMAVLDSMRKEKTKIKTLESELKECGINAIAFF